MPRSCGGTNWRGVQAGHRTGRVLARQGHRVCYVCGTNESAPVNPTTIQGVELWRYHAPAAGASHARSLIRHVQGAYRLTVEILRRSPVVCLNGHSPLQFLGASLAIGKNARQVYSVHSPFPDEIASNQRGRRRGIKQRAMVRVARMIERSNVRRADSGARRFAVHGRQARRVCTDNRASARLSLRPAGSTSNVFNPPRMSRRFGPGSIPSGKPRRRCFSRSAGSKRGWVWSN